MVIYGDLWIFDGGFMVIYNGIYDGKLWENTCRTFIGKYRKIQYKWKIW